jgi:cellulose synthase/poly-beta-1,6-N-acetylglucosamine synthase-like glycosyltransferase
MHKLMEIVLLTAYFIPAGILLLFGINLYYTLFLFIRRYKTSHRQEEAIAAEFSKKYSAADLPRVVTQIPLYNEFNVAERVMRAAAAMDYPRDRHTIQMLDDSTDDTRATVRRVADELRAKGHDIQVLHRPTREGFKAGALQYGMEQAPGVQFFAIFDADFVPPKDFLMRTVPVMLVRPAAGLVQARWGHLNADDSFVTWAQSIGIDGHFAIEQPARAWNRLFMNFNGTAGLWRRQAIEQAGGWEHDTLTEDMDISYRAQLAGWKPFFLFDLVVPAELPDNINAFKAQQFRWAKGSTQTAIKLLPRVFRSNASLIAKIQAAFHMTHYVIHPLMVCVAFLALPVLLFTSFRNSTAAFVALFALLLLATIAPLTTYIVSQVVLYENAWKRLRFLPLLSSLGIGIAISNSRAVIEAILGIQSAFIRTPKKGEQSAKRYSVKLSYGAIVEILVGAYCFATFFVFMAAHKYFAVPFLFLYAWGFTGVGFLSMLHFFQQNRWVRAAE